MSVASASVRRKIAVATYAALAFAVSVYAARRTIDFPVYYATARALLDHGGPVYGTSSGLGWPMVYRYPPLFLVLFLPFAWLPIKTAAGLWAALKFALLWPLARAIARRANWPGGWQAWVVAVALAGSYTLQEFRYGNAQFYLFALVASAMLLVEQDRASHVRHAIAVNESADAPRGPAATNANNGRAAVMAPNATTTPRSGPLQARDAPGPLQAREALAGVLLGLAIALKLWPAFFVPYLIARRRWRTAAWSIPLAAAFTLLPVAYFGWHGNLVVLHAWYAQEFVTLGHRLDIWFPSQALRGVLTRYLMAIDYSRMPDPNYPQVNVAALDPATVKWIWLCAAAAGEALLLWVAARGRRSAGAAEAGVGWCALVLLQPFTYRQTSMVVLLWPAIVAGAAISPGARRAATLPIVLAVVLAVAQPLIPGAHAQRVMQALGVDAVIALLLAAGLVALSFERKRSLSALSPW